MLSQPHIIQYTPGASKKRRRRNVMCASLYTWNAVEIHIAHCLGAIMNFKCKFMIQFVINVLYLSIWISQKREREYFSSFHDDLFFMDTHGYQKEEMSLDWFAISCWPLTSLAISLALLLIVVFRLGIFLGSKHTAIVYVSILAPILGCWMWFGV